MLGGEVSASCELPLVLTPAPHSALASSAASANAWVTAHEEELLALLERHGALLFRGFALSSAEDFGAFVSGFKSLADLPYEDSLSYAVRLPVCERVCTTNEGKLGGMTFHHEQGAWR